MNSMNRIHRALITLSGGRLGWRMAGMPMLELTTTGRKSGELRSTMLSSPLQPHGSYVVVASRGGDDRHPAWYLNLVENPEVQVVFQGGAREVRHARVATEVERARLWPIITDDHKNYAGYQEKTDREIPLVFLDPIRETGPSLALAMRRPTTSTGPRPPRDAGPLRPSVLQETRARLRSPVVQETCGCLRPPA